MRQKQISEKEYRKYLDGVNSRDHDACGIGAIVNIDGHQDTAVVDDALKIVEKLEHRAGKDATGKVGDGVGIQTQVPAEFFGKACRQEGFEVGKAGDFGVGMLFLPQNTMQRTFAMRRMQVIAGKENLPFLGWRKVPVNPQILGKPALDCMPEIWQCFVGRPEEIARGLAFEQRLYVLRREFEQSGEDTYVCSFSSRTIVYKGMFLVSQLRRFYSDLTDPDYKSAIAIVHSRFSTNTTPSWERAHPYRFIAHNGEINTIRGNIDRMLAREETMQSSVFAGEIEKVYPVVNKTGSDSAMLDNTLEFLYMNGIPLPLALMITIPEPWKHNDDMDRDRRDFYHYYATMMEPWDGPAAILASDGEILAATLDRNGLRPSRYYLTDDGRLILSSEVGVLPIGPEHIIRKSRLAPGRILLVDTKQKRIISDAECKQMYSRRQPYGEWLNRQMLHLSELKIPNKKVPGHTQAMRNALYKAFGYTYEDMKSIILPMAENGVEPTVSMGHDVPLAALSKKHQLLFNYFKQLFAQVTNPPIDSLREKIVTDTTIYLGSDGDLLNEKSENCRVLEINDPILTGVDLMKIRELNEPGFKTCTVSMLYYASTSLEAAVTQLTVSVDRAIAEGNNIIILSDRGVDENHMAIPSLLAVSAVEQHLVLTRRRTSISLVLESGEPRDVHQVACLLGFGVRAVQPYLAHECIAEMIDNGLLDKDYHTAIADYNKALLSGVVKTAAKMGISTLQSYQSARIFEAVGLNRSVIDKYFAGVVSRAGGIGIKEIGEGVMERHEHAFDPLGLSTDQQPDSPGFHYLRSGEDKEDHLYTPETIVLLQRAVRDGSYEEFKEYTKLVDAASRPHTLRALLGFKAQNKPIPIGEVEPVSEIVKRFQTGAMSYGALSEEAHETLAIAMNTLGGLSNTGEGGEDESRFGTIKNSAIKQVASARFGVTSAYLNSAKEIQIKMAQGAKPGEGGHLPGRKVYPWVAKVRCSTPGVSLISPPPHHDIYSIEDLAELIYDLKNANRDAKISVKLVSEAGVGTIASGVAKAGAQVILISGYDGGTGAAPYSSIHNAGLPWELGISEAHRSLIENGLRDRVALETDGKLMSGRDVAIAALLGAEEFSFGTAPLVCLGCMMMRVCSKNTCPAGIATQNEVLRRRFSGKPEYVINFMKFVAQDLREIMANLGFRTIDEMVGRTDCLIKRENLITDRAEMMDVTSLLNQELVSAPKRHFDPKAVYNFHLEKTPDESRLLPWFRKSADAFDAAKKEGEEEAREAAEKSGIVNIASVRYNLPKFTTSLKVSSTDRALGTILGSEVTRRYRGSLPDDTFTVEAEGGGGQSFGAFIPKGLTIRLTGDANDGFGKGLSGGRLVLVPPASSPFKAEENIIAGNVALYGATSGAAFIRGVVGERFLVRNSGVIAVAEGCGDHGCEYMTGGTAVILGPTGKNFAAGMSGGTAYVLDQTHTLYRRLNTDMVAMEDVTKPGDLEELQKILTEYEKETKSELAAKILADFDGYAKDFRKIVPNDYKEMLEEINKQRQQGLEYDEAVLKAFGEVTSRG